VENQVFNVVYVYVVFLMCFKTTHVQSHKSEYFLLKSTVKKDSKVLKTRFEMVFLTSQTTL